MDKNLDVNFKKVEEVWIDIPEDLIERMKDVVIAVSRGHGSSGTLIAEAQHLKVALDKVMLGG